MSGVGKSPSPELLARLRARAERRLTREEFDAYLEATRTDGERQFKRELIVWFRRRYPQPIDRLRYVRRAYARWTR